jgi:hypothetical protein
MADYKLRTDYDTYEVVLEKDGEEVIRGHRAQIKDLIGRLKSQIEDSKSAERSAKIRAATTSDSGGEPDE